MSAFSLDIDARGLGVLTFDQPDRSVNVFDRSTLQEFENWLDRLSANQDIRVLLLVSGKADGFIAGADIDLIAEVEDPAVAEAGARHGQELFQRWSQLPFPTIAAVRGICVGGGTELALASDSILVADSPRTTLGLPETQLGIVPGWGGCSRLPRRVGIAAALDMILTGRRLRPDRALRIGLADAKVPAANFEEWIRRLALRRLEQPLRRPRRQGIRDRLLEGNPLGRAILFSQARRRTLERSGGHYPAVLRAIEVVRVGVEKGLEAGLAAEARAVGELATSQVSKNLIHVFRLMESGKRADDADAAAPVRQVGVVGAGVMGGAIAQLVAAGPGVPVRLKDLQPAALNTALDHAATLFEEQVKRRRLERTEATRRLALILPTLDDSGFARCDLVIEAVVEKLAVKQQVFAELEARVGTDAVLASNTSSLPIADIASRLSHGDRAVGMHFFNPVHRMPLIEIIATAATSARTRATVAAFARALGKTPVVVRDTPGFLVNRLLMFYGVEALWLLDEGRRIEAIDGALVHWGMPMGPLALDDEVGIDVAAKVAAILHDAFGDRLPVPSWFERALTDGRLGRKNGRGFYHYESGRRGSVDTTIYEVLGLRPRVADTPEPQLARRMVLRMVDEAARCLAEGTVGSPAELDLALILGTGFPPFRGGLCRWADGEGLERLVGELAELAATAGERFTPSPALREAAASGGFYLHGWPGLTTVPA